MAGYMRLWNPQWKSATISEDEVRKKDVHGKYPITFEIIYYGSVSAATTQIGAAANNILDGTITPRILFIESTDALDTAGGSGTGVRLVRLIGLTVESIKAYQAGTEKPVYSVEQIIMSTSAHTLTARNYLRVMHMYACNWGAGLVAAGTITAGNDATPTTPYLTIAIGGNESNNGGRLYVGAGYYGRWKRLHAGLKDTYYAD